MAKLSLGVKVHNRNVREPFDVIVIVSILDFLPAYDYARILL